MEGEVCELQRKPQPSKTAEDATIIPRPCAPLSLAQTSLCRRRRHPRAGNHERLFPTKRRVNILRRRAGKKSRVWRSRRTCPFPAKTINFLPLSKDRAIFLPALRT